MFDNTNTINNIEKLLYLFTICVHVSCCGLNYHIPFHLNLLCLFLIPFDFLHPYHHCHFSNVCCNCWCFWLISCKTIFTINIIQIRLYLLGIIIFPVVTQIIMISSSFLFVQMHIIIITDMIIVCISLQL